MFVLIQVGKCLEEAPDVKIMNKILQTIFVMLLLASPAAAWYSIGNAQKEYTTVGITCYLGHLFPGQPIYWCLYADGSMDHSYFVNQYQEMDRYYTGGLTTTLTVKP